MGWLEVVPSQTLALWVVTLALAVWLGSLKTSTSSLVLLSFIGTTCHEAAHFIVGLLLGAHPTKVSLFPKKIDAKRWMLGSVTFKNMRWWNRAPTALAPMLLAPSSMAFLHFVTSPDLTSTNFGSVAFQIAMCAMTLQGSWPSTTDFLQALPCLILIALIVSLINF